MGSAVTSLTPRPHSCLSAPSPPKPSRYMLDDTMWRGVRVKLGGSSSHPKAASPDSRRKCQSSRGFRFREICRYGVSVGPQEAYTRPQVQPNTYFRPRKLNSCALFACGRPCSKSLATCMTPTRVSGRKIPRTTREPELLLPNLISIPRPYSW